MKCFEKKSFGVLLPVSALPGEYGIGDMGTSAYHFIDWLDASSASYWQVIPTTIADPITGCPYASMSAFGGYPDLISPEKLVEINLLTLDDLVPVRVPVSDIDYTISGNIKRKLLESAFIKFSNLDDTQPLKTAYKTFSIENKDWCFDTANFLYLTEKHGESWWEWDNQYKDYQLFKESFNQDIPEIKYHLFIQYVFDLQWSELKKYANGKSISLIGDIPIFLSHHSMDVWRNPENFKLNEDFTLKVQTGVPPDAFSENGQTWNTPNYDWQKMSQDNFKWWKNRFSYTLDAFDIIRFDHFVGLVNVFEIPPKDTHGKNGKWVLTPGDDLLKSITQTFPDLPMIVEDLGEKTLEVENLKNKYSLPGMKILMFAYSSDETNEHLPENYQGNEVVYTGTHDNNTIIGHFETDASEKEIINIKKRLNINNLRNINWDVIEESFKSPAPMAIIPLQDFLGLDSSARFNIPGTIDSNWVWRFKMINLKKQLADKICKLAQTFNRQNI